MEASTSSPTLSGLQGLRMGLSPPLVSPEDVQLNVFTTIEEEMAVDSTFLVSAIVEYMRRYNLWRVTYCSSPPIKVLNFF